MGMEEFASASHGLMFFVFMIVIIILVLAGFVTVFAGMITKIRSFVQQMTNVIFILYPLFPNLAKIVYFL